MAQKFRKKPVEIEAERLQSDNVETLATWCGGRATLQHDKEYVTRVAIIIDTLEGAMTAMEGDWIICGVAGEFYPCKPDIFDATYEAA